MHTILFKVKPLYSLVSQWYGCFMYHFVWVDQRERQGYRSGMSLGGDADKLYPGKWCHSSYRHNGAIIDCGFEFVNNMSL